MTKEKPASWRSRIWEFLNQNFVSAVVAPVVILALTALGLILRDQIARLASWTMFLVVDLWNYSRSSMSVPVWILGIMMVLAAIPIVEVVLLVWAWANPQKRAESEADAKPKSTPREPTWQEYTQDTFDGMIWKWGYEGGKPIPKGLWCFCPDDQTRLIDCHVERSDLIAYECERCGRKFGPFRNDQYVAHTLGRAQRYIEQTIATEGWKAVVQLSGKARK